jgi:chaperonin cofactor prefoldin
MNNILDFLKELAIIGGGGIFAFFAGRKSKAILEKHQTVDAIDAMQKTYDVFLTHYKYQFDELTDRLNALELRNALLTESAETWEKKFKVLEKQHETLKKQFESYKLNHK